MRMQVQPHDFRAVHMRGMGVKLLAVSYSCTGALLGQFLVTLCQRPEGLQEKPDLVLLVFLANLLCLPGLVLFFRRGAADPPIHGVSELFQVLIGPRPVTNRVASFLFTAAWVIGLILASWFSARSALPR